MPRGYRLTKPQVETIVRLAGAKDERGQHLHKYREIAELLDVSSIAVRRIAVAYFGNRRKKTPQNT